MKDPGPMLRPERLVGLVLRTGHLVTVSLALGAAAYQPASLARWLGGSAVTGAGLLLLEASHGRTWAVQVNGLLALGHLAMLGLVPFVPGPAPLLAAVILGAVGSHLPKRIRKWSVVHRRTME